MEEKMRQNELMENEKEKVLLAGLDLSDGRDFPHSMEELEQLADACDMEVVGVVTQKLPQQNKAFYMGSGKVEEIRELVGETEADLVIFDSALSPIQLRNLQDAVQTAVMDRTTLILEIFSKRARTREAKLQVEVARLQYMLPRLVGLHDALSRQGGGSGSMSNKGAGEKKLELDRRHIEGRLATYRRELTQVEKDRETQRKARMRGTLPMVSLVGYTNAGKSSVMNALVERSKEDEEKKVLEKDMLFATLETTVRKITSEDGKSFLLSDTVGFIDELPHNLVKAFRSTLEEAKNADLLLQVVDASDPYYREHMEVTKKTLKELEVTDIPMIRVFNKMDLKAEQIPDADYPKRVEDSIFIAAGKGIGIEELIALIEEKLFGGRQRCSLLIPYTDGGVHSILVEKAEILVDEYREDGIYVEAYLDETLAGRYRKYILED